MMSIIPCLVWLISASTRDTHRLAHALAAYTYINRKEWSNSSGSSSVSISSVFISALPWGSWLPPSSFVALILTTRTYTHAHGKTDTHLHTAVRGEALIQFHFLLELGQMPLSVSCITFTFIIYTHTQRKREKEWERERQQDRQWVRACVRHINARWECKWSYSCETAACCKESGLCRPTPCQRVFGHRAELWERAAEKDPGMFSWMDKNSPQSISVVGLTGDKRANKSFHSVRRDGLMWLSEQIYVCVSIFFQCLAGCQTCCQTFITALFRLSLNTTSERYEHASHIWTLSKCSSALDELLSFGMLPTPTLYTIIY